MENTQETQEKKIEDFKGFKENPVPAEDRIETHQESGLKFYKIKLTGVGSEGGFILRLFESRSPGRLKWEHDEETHDEYRVRRSYMAKANKKKGTLIWNSDAWGSINQVNALRVQAAINEGKNLSTIGKLK